MTRLWFDEQMARLAGLRFVPSDMTTHWEALRDLPQGVLEQAVGRAGRTRVEFPTPIELRQDADQITRRPTSFEDRDQATEHPARELVCEALGMTLRLNITRDWRYDCDTCSDSGWEMFWCGPAGVHTKQRLQARTCDHRGEHAPHEWTAPCPCRETNPTIRRRRDRDAKYADKPGKVTA